MTSNSKFDQEWATMEENRRKEMLDSIIGPGPFYCRDCGKQMIEAGHMFTSFFMCPDAGEFTPGAMIRVEKEGVSYWADPSLSPEDLEQQREYFKQSREAHKYATEHPGARQYVASEGIGEHEK